ncbi:MAG: hypothetical protein ABI893_02165 [Polaromonas sp.]|uniref:hypothetical protein n=1 Tax=Polaromonas sp. TaxID=1869339 RepID=UPI003262FD9B
MRRLVACLACTLSVGLAAAAAPVDDNWSGHYGLQWLGASQPGSRVVLVKAPDADPGKLMEKYQSDLARWTIAYVQTPTQTVSLRRFLETEYEGFGWVALHAAGQIECLDASHIFVCRTTPGTTVKLGPDGPTQESLLASTGVFGILLHAGAFELNKE